MFCLNDSTRFLLYPYPTDMRKSFYSLSGIVTNHMGKNVQDGDAYIFYVGNKIMLVLLRIDIT
ncbi:IS66 family insertion sequence element accessory protein TnpB [Bacteroides thetaiotaomicron]|nr:IS66 family insertion sequence element accessory protein TnpB [Bacteroides thetaiotaomicron]